MRVSPDQSVVTVRFAFVESEFTKSRLSYSGTMHFNSLLNDFKSLTITLFIRLKMNLKNC